MRGRPSYPAEAVRKLIEELGIQTGRTIVELGSGTGKFTKQLVPTGARVIAVEPVEGMRQNSPKSSRMSKYSRGMRRRFQWQMGQPMR